MFGVFYAVFVSNKNLRVAAFAGDFIMFYVARKEKKDGSGTYLALFADLGYRQLPVTFKVDDLSELTGLSVRELRELPVGERVEVTK